MSCRLTSINSLELTNYYLDFWLLLKRRVESCRNPDDIKIIFTPKSVDKAINNRLNDSEFRFDGARVH